MTQQFSNLHYCNQKISYIFQLKKNQPSQIQTKIEIYISLSFQNGGQMAQLVIRQTDKIPKRSSSSVNGSQGSASTAAEALTSDIEAEHLPVVMSARDLVNRSEFVSFKCWIEFILRIRKHLKRLYILGSLLYLLKPAAKQ